MLRLQFLYLFSNVMDHGWPHNDEEADDAEVAEAAATLDEISSRPCCFAFTLLINATYINVSV